MTLLPSGVKIHVALGVTDMRKGLDGLAMLVQGTLKHYLFSGHLFVFRGRKADLLKILFWDGTGALSVHQEAGAEPVLLACRGRGHRLGHADHGAAVDADRGHRLAIAAAEMAASCSRLMICGRLTWQWAIPMRRAASRRSFGVWTSILLPCRMMLMPCIS